MADVEIGRDTRIYVDLPGPPNSLVAVVVTDPLGNQASFGNNATPEGGSRHSFVLEAATINNEGVWEVEWEGSGGVERVRVGERGLLIYGCSGFQLPDDLKFLAEPVVLNG